MHYLNSASSKLLAILLIVLIAIVSIGISFYAYTQNTKNSPLAIEYATPTSTPIPSLTPTATSPPSSTAAPSSPTPGPTLTPTTPAPNPTQTTANPTSTATTTPEQTSPTPTTAPTPTPTLSPTPTTVKTSLTNAISSGLVQASFSGTGSCAGDCIKLNIKRLVSYDVELEPPALGTSLTSSGNAQNMVILSLQGIDQGASYTPTSRILLADSNSVTYIFRAYCLNFHKANPSSSDQFSMTGTANSEVTKILNAASGLSSNVASIAAVQTAIWVVTDNVSLQELRSTFPSGASQLENAKTILTAAGIDVSGKQLFAS